jgi:hypothetical protein
LQNFLIFPLHSQPLEEAFIIERNLTSTAKFGLECFS